MANSSFKSIEVYAHHLKQDICASRAKYREGRKDTAVKVYTVNQESVYLLISNVPAVGGSEDLQALCDQYGVVVDFCPLDDYPCEEFTEVFLVKYASFPSARNAKKQLDDKVFLGSALHVCYAPEFESVSETSNKLQERRKFVAWKTNSGKHNSQQKHSTNLSTGKPTTSQTATSPEPVTYVWAGKEYTVYPDTQPATSHTENQQNQKTEKRSFSDESFNKSVANIRSKVSRFSMPNVRVSHKRRRRI